MNNVHKIVVQKNTRNWINTQCAAARLELWLLLLLKVLSQFPVCIDISNFYVVSPIFHFNYSNYFEDLETNDLEKWRIL